MKRLLFFCFLLSAFSSFAQEKPEGLFINSKAPDFKAPDQNGQEINLKDLRKKGDVVVVFYRGYWCPYCNRFLRKLNDSLDLIRQKGAQVVVVTMEGEAGVDSTVAKIQPAFPIISDKDGKISNGYKVAFKVDERTLGRYKNADIDLLKINGQTKDAYLPVPAVYVVNTDGSVTYRFFEEDYKRRISVKEILGAIK